MEPQIQYPRTADAMNIAYATFGAGAPIVVLSDPPCSHVQLEWDQPPLRAMFERLGAHKLLVRYDPRGLGLSDRDTTNFSLDARVSDLEAVADRTRLEPFALVAHNNAGPVAIRYAVKHPERVTHLVLWNTVVDGKEQFRPTPQVQAMTNLLEHDWEMFTENMVGLAFGWGREDTPRYGAFLRECVDRETLLRMYAAFFAVDVSDELPQISVPTLAVHQSGIPMSKPGREVAAEIPAAKLVVFDGSWGEHAAEIASAILRFIGDGDARTVTDASASSSTGTAIILFADIVDSTALTERMGDAAFRAASRALDERVRAAIRDAGGTPVEGKVLGDGVMGVFRSAAQAIGAARTCVGAAEAAQLQLHIGIHAGDVIHEKDNVYGGAVNIASRISGLSAPGEVLVSDTVRSLARTSAGVRFEDRGEHALKGVADAQRVFAVTREP